MQRLDPLLSWTLFDGGKRLQLRFPDGNHVTFDSDAETVARCLDDFDKHGIVAKPNDSIAAELARLLMSRRAITSRSDSGSDWALDVFDYILRWSDEGAALGTPLMSLNDARALVRGAGWLADVLRECMATLGVAHASNVPDATFVVDCQDRQNPQQFSATNAFAVQQGLPCFFVYREVSRIVVGPLVVPRQSACYQCYSARLEANAPFPAEHAAYQTYAATETQPRPSQVAVGLVNYLLARAVLCTVTGAYELFEPGVIYSYDFVSLDTSTQRVLKVPRCEACSKVAGKPMRSVRSVI